MNAFNVIGTTGAVGSAIAGIVYMNFSARIMPRLRMSSEIRGIEKMQQFNRNAVKAPFLSVFFGSAAASAALIINCAASEDRSTQLWLASTGGALYLCGFVLTITYNVPRNDQLARVNPGSTEASFLWQQYLHEWTSSNTVRAVFSLTGSALMGAGTALSCLR